MITEYNERIRGVRGENKDASLSLQSKKTRTREREKDV